MATGGGKPGITSKVTPVHVAPAMVTFTFKDPEDAEYFKLGNEYVAFFLPTPPSNPGGDGDKQGNG